MFAFNLKKTKVWVTMALLLLSFSICPHSCYPHAEEDVNLNGAVENVDNAEDYESVQNNDDEDEDLTEDTDVEDGPTDAPDCTPNWSDCTKNQDKKCCPGPDKSPFSCVRPGKISAVYWCIQQS